MNRQSRHAADPFPSLLGKSLPPGEDPGVARSAGWGAARRDRRRIARPSPRTFIGSYLLSTPHPAFGHLPRFAEKGMPVPATR